MTQQSVMPEPHTDRRIFLARVVRTAPVTPHMVRITLAGEDLTRYEDVGPDQFLYVFLPGPNGGPPRVGHDFTWEGWRDLPPEERPVGRYYTVRYCRPERGELDLDFVLHGDGPATAWAVQAKSGDAVALWGPRFAYTPPAATDFLLLLADETGLPATAAILESLAPGIRAHACIEVRDRSAEQPLPSEGAARITWLHRGDRTPGDALLHAVRTLDLLPRGVTAYVWGGAEFNAMMACRAYLVEERGLAGACIRTVGYWRHDQARANGDAGGSR
ncbi:MAG: siderophore-interacting protein [Dehalococcoidia bacterium]